MGFCHGNGNPETDGCCWVNGEVCPLRLKVVDGRVKEGPTLTDRGTVNEYADSQSDRRPLQLLARAQLAGVTYACRAAVEVLVEDPSRVLNRPAFEEAWNNHPDYVAQVRPHWEVIEEQLDLPEGGYQCSTWRGVGTPQCCFSETSQTNSSKAAALAADARSVRQAGGM